MTAVETFRRSMRRIEKRALRQGVKLPTVSRARRCNADASRCNIDFARWATEDRKDRTWHEWTRRDRDRLRRQAFFHTLAAHAVSRYLASACTVPKATP